MKPTPLLKKVLAVLIVIIGAHLCGQAQPPPAANQEAVAALRVAAVEDATAPAGWKRYQIGDPVAFSMVLPGTPQYEGKRFSPAEGSLVARIYISSSPTGVYAVNYIESPPTTTFDKSQTKTFFNGYIAGFVNGFKESLQAQGSANWETKMGEERSVRISGFDGYEQNLSIGPIQGRIQAVFLSKNVYATLVFWMAENPLSERTAFFNSFQIHRRH